MEMIGPVPYKNQCYDNYFYGEDGIWEERLQQMETKWGVVFQKANEGKALTEDDIQLIKEFAMYQRQRTQGEEAYRTQEREQLLIEYGKQIYKLYGWDFDEKAEEACRERAQCESSPAENLELAQKLVHFVDDLSLVIITYRTEAGLISSDVPVIAINPFYPPFIGYACIGLILLFPISEHKLVVIYDSKMYPRFKSLLYVDSDDGNEVHNINVLQLISADKILFSQKTPELLDFSKDEWNARNMNRESQTVSRLGTGKNQIWMTSMRKTIYKCELSFGQVCHRFRRIPFICKEAPPRFWDADWEKKLDQKGLILSQIAELTPHILSDYGKGITRKELRKGCQRMATATKVYWTY